jgi:MFS family permease
MTGMTLPVDAAAESPVIESLPVWRRRLVTLVLLTGGLKSVLAFTTIVPGLQLVAREFSNSADATLSAQFVVTLAPIGMALAGLLAGLLVKTTQLRSTMFISLAVTTVAGLLPLILFNYGLLLASRFVLGFSAVIADVAMTSMLAIYYGGETRSKLIGYRQSISHIGTVTTLLASGWLAQHYGWRAPSLMFILPAVLLLVAFLAFDRSISIEKKEEDGPRPAVMTLAPLLILSLLMALGHAMPHFQMPFLLRENGITDAVLVSRVPALSAAVSILSAFIFGWVYGRLGVWTLPLASALMGIGFIGAGLAPSYGVILAFVVIEGVGAGWTMPFFLSRILDRMSPRHRNYAIGLTLSSLFFGQFLNPIVTKPIRDAVGLHMAFVVIGVAMIVIAAAIGMWVLSSRRATPPAASVVA